MAKQSYGSVPSDAKSNGAINDGPPQDQRKASGAPLSDGPKRHPDTLGFAPASYRVKSGIRTDR